MSGTWGKNIKYTIFGESHGEGIGIVIDNLPPGLELNMEDIQKELDRRRPGGTPLGTSRDEKDSFQILSGIFQGFSTGAPLCCFIRNTNQRSQDYDELKSRPRPGHADYTGYIKYKGFHDYRGGGHFSGRLTAALVFAGNIAKQLLARKGIEIVSHICKIGDISDTMFDSVHPQASDLRQLSSSAFPTLSRPAADQMREAIESARAKGDSIGGIVETAILKLPAGIGSPFFDSLESTIAHLIFSIPGVKGLEFGDGFKLAEMKGSEANDSFVAENGLVKTSTNHCGGILGGISSGMPVIFKTAFKPTSSIAQEQATVDLSNMTNTSIQIQGRHDPCIVPRALPVVNAAAAMAVLDALPLEQL